jgi:hypothetical protein
VPDRGYHRGVPSEVFVPTAAVVVFYARHGVEEICVADPRARQIAWPG